MPPQQAPEITGLTADSRAVKPGYLFAALPGVKIDGRTYITDAIRQGARAILVPSGTMRPPELAHVPMIESAEPRRTFALMAAAFYGKQPKTIAAVTGTNGKTSTVQFARQIWDALGYKAASLGTLGLVAPGFNRAGALTTSDPVALHADLSFLAEQGVTHAAIEASSHGLEQFRLDGVKISAAAFTNLTRDHLDYHLTLDAYFTAKLRLFQSLVQDNGTVVLNADIPQFKPLKAAAETRGLHLIAYGRQGHDLMLADQSPLPYGQKLGLRVRGRAYQVELNLIGSFQAMNVLAAIGLVMSGGEDIDAIMDILPRLEGIAGRMQRVATHPNGAPVFVDYAHTPDALETILQAMRPHVTGRLVVVFGCGGDRDRGKRPLMGEIACRLADKAYVTDDNPRSEDPATIRAEILNACSGAEEIGDREDAIQHAVSSLQPGDLLMIAGKGHEQGQIIGTNVRPFDDAEIAQKAVDAIG